MSDLVQRMRDETPAHYYDCDRFQLYDYNTRYGKCDCTATADIERLLTWDGLMELLDEYWPEGAFPTLPDDDKRDPGPRIVSLLRWVDTLQDKLNAAREMPPHHGGDA